MHDNIESHLVETRVFQPPRDFSSKARIKSLAQYQRMHRESIRQPAKFWAREASELVWQARWKKVLQWKAPFAKWFVGGKLNISENCLDRHLSPEGFRGNKAAIIWEGEPGDKRTLTYQQLHREVCRFANVLKRNKIGKGRRVIIYLPTIPEAAIAMLACARIGAVHSVVFGGFSADSIRDRIHDSGAIALITADVGWVTGHSYVVYGPLANGATTFMYEGAPNWPEPDRFWKIIEQNRINILYTAPTAIRAFIRWGDQWVKKHDLSSLRLLGTVGEPINPEAWMWYHKNVGGVRCPIVDTWWQTETGMIMVTPLPGAIPTKPGSATLPFFGVDPTVVDPNGKEVGANVGWKLIIRGPG